MKDGIFPDVWKQSIIVPVPKVKNAKTPLQFRPINNYLQLGVKGDKGEIKIRINQREVEIVDQYKYLGIVIDKKLKFKENVDYICKKFGMKIGVL